MKTTSLSGLLCLLGVISGCGGVDGGEQGQDPTVTDIPVPVADMEMDMEPDSLEQPAAFMAGARLMVRDGLSSGAVARDISTPLLGGGHDIRDLVVSPAGDRLLFSARAPEIEDADEDEQPTWNLWEYDFNSRVARRLVTSDLIAEQGQDRYPAYLPGGGIVFASTRQRQARARLLDEGKPQFAPLEEGRDSYAFALHVMGEDGNDIEQITFNMSHDVAPLVMDDGRIVFQRWDNKDNEDRFDLYRVNPDGTSLTPLYGADSHAREDQEDRQFLPMTMMGDGRVLTAVRLRELVAGNSLVPVAIDVARFVNQDTPLFGIVGAQAEQPLPIPVTRLSGDITSGTVADVLDLGDGTGRYLMAWSPCRLLEGQTLRPCTDEYLSQDLPAAPPAYGLWVFDPAEGTQRPVVNPRDGLWVTELAVATPQPSAAPAVLPERDDALAEDNMAMLDIRSVHDRDGAFATFDGGVAGVNTIADYRDPNQVSPEQRAVRFLRITKGVLIPDDDVRDISGAQFGRAPNFGMREIVGYIPVEPDGSVRVQVPADAPLGLQLVDAEGKAVYSRHGAWINLRPGETLQCQGCHSNNSPLPHGRIDGMAPSLNAGAPFTGQPFPNTRSDVVGFADAGETMAQALTRLYPERAMPSVDLRAFDAWSDPAPDPDTEVLLSYEDLNTPTPVTPECQGAWAPGCRATIHYEDHIQPLWDLPRVADVDGSMQDVTCSVCHNRRDSMNALQVPPGQLELTGDPSPDQPDQLTSYRELLFNDNELELQDGALVDRLVIVFDDEGNIVYQTDEEGELVLDGDDNPVPVTEPVPVAAAIRAGQARNSDRFFDTFAVDGGHEEWLSAQELRLIAEWIDIGAQLYNDPFRVPEN